MCSKLTKETLERHFLTSLLFYDHCNTLFEIFRLLKLNMCFITVIFLILRFRFGGSIVNFKHILQLDLISLLSTLNIAAWLDRKAFSEPSQTSKMELFEKIVNDFQFLTIFPKSFLLDLWLASGYVFAAKGNKISKGFYSNVSKRCL